ncbi:TPM domain-containing protein [Thomasclavelia cocleata]|uniref:TPM domain-containing protein n=1 Tax=Thomasclavelia cocleata TaxID=69824 RepID=UPI00242C554D|nr:TPM domain-containing protein [Thomasclavelia cocleata]MCI9130938.1 TPM domain-containing protein [Thomasclavelia cocleata]
MKIKKIKYILLVLLLIFTTIAPIHAENKYVYDNANRFRYLSESLEQLSQNFYEQYNINIVIVSVENNQSDFNLGEYANQLYQENFGETDGVVYAINFSNGSDYGKYMNAFGNAGQYLNNCNNMDALITGHDKVENIVYKIQLIVYQMSLIIDNVEPSRNIVDMANILNSEQTSQLEQKITQVINNCQMDVVILTTCLNNGKSMVDFADDYYDENDYGIDLRKSGLILVLSLQDNEWYISTSGAAIDTFSDWGIEYLGKVMKPSLVDRNFYQAFEDFVSYTEKFNVQAVTDKPYDRYNQGDLPNLDVDEEVVFDNQDNSEPKTKMDSNKRILISLGAGLIIGFIISFIRMGKLNTKKSVKNANEYVKENSFKLTKSNDLYLYQTVTKRARPKYEDNNHSTSSYHKTTSSTHRSSSGRTHGGGGGKF